MASFIKTILNHLRKYSNKFLATSLVKIYSITLILYFVCFLIYLFFVFEHISKEINDIIELVNFFIVLFLIPFTIFLLLFQYSPKLKFKHIDEITSLSNVEYYIFLFFLVKTFSVDILHPISTIIFFITISCITFFSFYILTIKFIQLKVLFHPVILGQLLFIYLILNSFKQVYITYYGNELYGSFWEKPDYTKSFPAILYMNEDNSDSIQILANIHFYDEISDYEDEDGYIHSSSERIKKIVGISFDNGENWLESIYDCEFKFNEKEYCPDLIYDYKYIKILNN